MQLFLRHGVTGKRVAKFLDFNVADCVEKSIQQEMIMIKKLLGIVFLLLFTVTTLAWVPGCVVVTRRPAPRVEIKPHKPAAHAVWVKGHWKWKGTKRRGKWIWIPGHWRVRR